MRRTAGGVGVFLVVAAVGAVLWYSTDLTTDSVEKPVAQVAVSVASALPPSMSTALAVAGSSSDLSGLVVRCQAAMSKDLCGVMAGNAPPANQGSSERLFIAGIGEVDAKAFNRLREAGDKMCGEVQIECAADWLGAGCKIAKAMYPV